MPIGVEQVLKGLGLIREFITNSTLLISVLLVTVAIIFLPDTLASKMGVAPIRQSNVLWLSIALLIAGSILLAKILVFIGQKIWETILFRKKRQILYNLSRDEKDILKQFIDNDCSAIYVDMRNGVSAGLIAYGVLYQANPMVDILRGRPINIHPGVRIYLKKNPRLLL